MKKKILFFAFIVIISTSAAFADHPSDKLGIGVVGSYNNLWNGSKWGPSLSLKLPSIPIFWTAYLTFGENHFGFGLSGDKYFIENVLVPEINLHWYLGVGGWGSLYTAKDNDNAYLSFGARLPIGLSWHVVEILEIFLEIAPSLGIRIIPLHFPEGGWPVGLGIRLWL